MSTYKDLLNRLACQGILLCVPYPSHLSFGVVGRMRPTAKTSQRGVSDITLLQIIYVHALNLVGEIAPHSYQVVHKSHNTARQSETCPTTVVIVGQPVDACYDRGVALFG